LSVQPQELGFHWAATVDQGAPYEGCLFRTS